MAHSLGDTNQRAAGYIWNASAICREIENGPDEKHPDEKHPILELFEASELDQHKIIPRVKQACEHWNRLAQTKNIQIWQRDGGTVLSKDEIVDEYFLREEDSEEEKRGKKGLRVRRRRGKTNRP
jgi:hypothetical protein